MPTVTVYAGAADGQISNSGGTWATVRSASTGTSRDKTSAWVNATQVQNDTGTYYIDRAFFPFDTSVIGSGNTVTAATLNVYAHSKLQSGVSDSLAVVASTQASATDLATSDFGSVGSTNFTDSSPTVSGMSTSAYTSITLNSSGLAAISTTGYTKLAFRSTSDLNNTAPSLGTYSILRLYCSEQTGTSNDAYLSVTYSVPTIRTFTADAVITSPARTFTADGTVVDSTAFTDAFTDTNGTNVQSHSPSAGSWSRWYDGGASQSATIQSNKALGAAGYSVGYRHSDFVYDGEVGATFSISGSHNDGGYALISLRHTGATPGVSSAYRVLFSNGAGGTAGTLYLLKLVSGSDTQLGTYNIGTLSSGSTYPVALRASGSSLTVYLNGTSVITATDSAITNAGYVHFEINRPISNGIVGVDDFRYSVVTTTTRTFTADAVVANAQANRTFTADGIVKVAVTRTFTADGIASAPVTRTFTADGYVNGTSYWSTSSSRSTSGSAVTVFSGGTIGTDSAHYAFPSGATAADGTQYIAARRATSHGSYDGMLVIKKSTDGGATWSSEATILDTAYDERDPSLTILASGRITMCWQRRIQNGISAGNDSFTPLFAYCDGDPTVAANWSSPITVTVGGGSGTGTVSNWSVASNILELANGNLLCATYGTPSYPWVRDRVDISKSTNGGTTWTYLSELEDGIGHGSYGVAEPELVQLANGTVYAIYRTVDLPWEIWARTSTDNGATWSSEFRIAQNSVNRAGICNSPDGDLVVGYAYLNTTVYFETSTNSGTSYGAAVDTTRSANVWVDPYNTRPDPVASSTVSLTYGNENGAQTQSSVYVQKLTSARTSVYVQRTLTATADAAIVSGVVTTRSNTVTADAVVIATAVATTRTFTADAVIVASVTAVTLTRAITADAVVQTEPNPDPNPPAYRLYFDIGPYL